ncbi:MULTISPECIES: zinc-ribbon domain-containing protein [unclassified Micromonospora]|uniref:zinc-ribbon domain-containing protein n=1 Tax=unclassified Micromonospora TaxID=2617518 RepID=UPI001C5FA9F1|nr:zinc-ribbon domain-containing protein [Micromonospora sp. RL09-050-HVF-A]MBW4705038.1 zinc-ribbon domain-containing protein [Micromonospora sp. RL09-050-HVF-A]
MFFIFGLRTKVTRSGVVTAVCRHCGNQAAQVISRRSTKFTLFFVPLIPIRTKYVQQCSFCGVEYAVDADEARRLPVG